MTLEFRLDRGKIQKARKLDSGSLVAPASLTRTGIFSYRNADGSERLEYRPASEVFSPQSLETLSGAPVTVGHPSDLVRSDNWRSIAPVGHVGDSIERSNPSAAFQQEQPEFVSAKLRIDDATAVARIEAGDLVEVSCGYQCEYDPMPGVLNGQPYDGVQKNIRYNHVALGGKDWGRAGPGAKIHMDSAEGVRIDAPILQTMSTNIKPTPVALSAEEIKKNVMSAPVALSAEEIKKNVMSELELAAAVKRADAAEGELAAIKSKLASVEANLAASEASLSARCDARVQILETARGILGKDFDASGKSDAQVKAEVVAKLDSGLRTDGKSEDYVTALFDALTSRAAAAQTAIDATRIVADAAAANGGAEADPIEAARKRAKERNAKLFAGK